MTIPLPLLASYPALPIGVALIGACIGSFLNLVAWRLPRGESILQPPSHCPRCGSRLHWHENLPVIGWLWLRGRCGHCGSPIAIRYPLVELLTAGLWVASLQAAPTALGPKPLPWLVVLAGWLLISWLLPLLLIDLDCLWLPEPLCRVGLLLGLAMTAVIGFQQDPGVGRSLVFHHLVAAGVGLVGFESTSALAQKLIGKPALGLGDAKLAALLGAWLGLAGLGATVVLAVFSGALVGSIGRLSGRLGRHEPFPFGPFLATAGAAVWLIGHDFWLSALGLMG